MDQDSYESYQSGKRGGSILTTKNVDAWVVGDIERRNQEALEAGPVGEEDPHGFQIIILMLVTGLPVGLFTYWGWLPWGYLISFLIWAVVTFALYKLLCLMPAWLSGLSMGLLLGGAAAYLGWTEGDIYVATGAGLGVGLVMFFLFYALD